MRLKSGKGMHNNNIWSVSRVFFLQIINLFEAKADRRNATDRNGSVITLNLGTSAPCITNVLHHNTHGTAYLFAD